MNTNTSLTSSSIRIRPKTVKLITRILRPLTEEGLIALTEFDEIISNLKHLARRNELVPEVLPKLISQKEAAEMLGISLANFKKLERENAFPFKRKMVGSSVRYRNTDIIKFIILNDEHTE